MLHSGFEPSAVDDMLKHPFKALLVYLRGPRTDGPMVPDILAEDSTPTRESSDDSKIEYQASSKPTA
jgi:hypothetical protein